MLVNKIILTYEFECSNKQMKCSPFEGLYTCATGRLQQQATDLSDLCAIGKTSPRSSERYFHPLRSPSCS